MFVAAKKDVAFNILLCILSGIITPVSLIASKYFTNELLTVIRLGHITYFLILWLSVIFTLAFLQLLISSLLEIVKTKLSDRVSVYITEYVLKKTYELPLADFENSTIYDKVQMTIQETPERCMALINTLGGILKNAIQVVGTFGILLNLHWLIGFLPILFLSPVYYLRNALGKHWFSIQSKLVEKTRYVSELKSILLRSNYIKEIRLFNISSYLVNKIIVLQRHLNKEKMENEKKHVKISILTIIVDGIYSFCVKLWIIYIGICQHLTIGDLSMYINTIDMYESSLQSILQEISYSLEQLLYIGCISEIDILESTRNRGRRIWKKKN